MPTRCAARLDAAQGIAVGMPIYYATGSRWKGFIWGTLSGFPLPMGGFIVGGGGGWCWC